MTQLIPKTGAIAIASPIQACTHAHANPLPPPPTPRPRTPTRALCPPEQFNASTIRTLEQ
eukprot:6213056-Pleurochrysis_carterae.AAC.6